MTIGGRSGDIFRDVLVAVKMATLLLGVLQVQGDAANLTFEANLVIMVGSGRDEFERINGFRTTSTLNGGHLFSFLRGFKRSK